MMAGYVNGLDHYYMSERRAGKIETKIAELNFEIYFAYTPKIILLDVVEAFYRRRPGPGTKGLGGCFLDSADRVAIGAVGVGLLCCLGIRVQFRAVRSFTKN